MQSYQKEFIEFAIDHDVLRFGEFRLKSGRISPYFFNAGLFNTGNALRRLGRFYAEAIVRSDLRFDTLFGPAYKGIPLVSATAVSLAGEFGRDVPFCFNRKETKDHGEGGVIVGAPMRGRILIVDDVITAGTAIRESMDLIADSGSEPAGVVVALDRQEMGAGERSAIQEVEEQFGLRVISVIGLAELMAFLESDSGRWKQLEALRDYRERYGIRPVNPGSI